jgi:hypothetical protein
MIRAIRTIFLLPAVLLAAGACATAGGTFGSGVGDQYLKEPPYYAGSVSFPVGRVAHLPIAYQQGASQDAMFDPDAHPGSPVAALLAEMNAYLDGLGLSSPLAAAGPVRGIAPDVMFGCDRDPLGDCIRESDDPTGRGAPWLRLAVGRPSPDWTRSAQQAMDAVGADRLLVLTLEIGQYWPHQRNLRGDKEVRLGTGHAVRVPWLTALDQPVQVLQLTGALVDPSGRAERIGAEGLVARRTNLLLLSVGVFELLTDADVEQVRRAVRTDLPGEPLVWQAALHDLLAELMARRELRILDPQHP